MDKKAWLQAAMAVIISAGVTAQAVYAAGEEAPDKPGFEKCYGIAKKGRNDCTAYQHGCGGASSKDGDPNEWLYVPNGTCEKIVNGSLTPGGNDKK